MSHAKVYMTNEPRKTILRGYITSSPVFFVSFLAGLVWIYQDNLRDGGKIITKTLPKYLLFTLFPVCVYPVNVPAFCRIF